MHHLNPENTYFKVNSIETEQPAAPKALLGSTALGDNKGKNYIRTYMVDECRSYADSFPSALRHLLKFKQDFGNLAQKHYKTSQ